MTDGHVDVGSASDTRCDIIDVEVEVLVDTGLQTERSDDSGIVELLGGLDILLCELVCLGQERLPQCGGVVTADGVLGNDSVLFELHLLLSGKPAVSVQGGLESPVDSQELQFLALLLQRGVEEVEVEDGTDDVLLHPCILEEVWFDDALLDELCGFLDELVVVLGCEESPLQLLDLVVDLDDGEPVDVLGLFDLLGEWESRLVEDPVVIFGVSPLLGSEEVPASDHGELEIVLNCIDSAVGNEGPVGNEKDIVLQKAVLNLGFQDAAVLVQNDGLVDGSPSEVALVVVDRLVISGERRVPSFLTDGDGLESLGFRSVACVKSRMGAHNSDLGLFEIDLLEIAKNLVSADHNQTYHA